MRNIIAAAILGGSVIIAAVIIATPNAAVAPAVAPVSDTAPNGRFLTSVNMGASAPTPMPVRIVDDGTHMWQFPVHDFCWDLEGCD